MDMMASTPLHVDDLPSEILIQILTPLPTAQLLPLARVNRRFYDLTLRIVHTRLTDAAWLPEHELILECYHPSAKLNTPYLHCDYLGTDGLASYDDSGDEAQQPGFGQLCNLYSRFRPVVQEGNRRGRARYPPTVAAPAATQAGGEAGVAAAAAVDDDLTASMTVQLDEGEMFSQLCAQTNLVKTGPHRGLFLSHVNINDGVVRVFRRWLKARAASGSDGDAANNEDPILWTNRKKTIGLKFRVTENVDTTAAAATMRRSDICSRVDDEDPAVSYTLVYEELLVRTSTLLLEVEKAEAQEVTSTGTGYVVEPGHKNPCLGQQMFFWIQTPQTMFQRQQQWGPAPFVSVGGA